MRELRKVSNILLVSAAALTILATIFSIFHNRVVARPMMNISLVILILGLAFAICLPLRANKSILNPKFYRQTIVYRNVLYLGCILIVTSLLLKIYHFPFSGYVRLAGLVLFLCAIVVYIYNKSQRDKYHLLNLKTIELSPTELSTYTGEYFNDQMNMYITITQHETNNTLVAQATGQSTFPLFAIEKNIFNYDQAGIVIEFKPEDNKLILIQHGGYFPFLRTV